MAVGLLVEGVVIVYLVTCQQRKGTIILLLLCLLYLKVVLNMPVSLTMTYCAGHVDSRLQGVSPCETVEMKENMSYGPVQVQSHTHSQGPADYQQPVNMEQAKDGEDRIYEVI